jgi:hypothetical protein
MFAVRNRVDDLCLPVCVVCGREIPEGICVEVTRCPHTRILSLYFCLRCVTCEYERFRSRLASDIQWAVVRPEPGR